MKDILIKGNRIKREVIIIVFCFVLALILNVVGIIIHGTEWKELLTQLHVVVILTFVIYLLLWFIRFIIWIVALPVKTIFKK